MALIKLRTGTTTQWTKANPILALGEPGYDSDSHVLKVGDGGTPWTSLKGYLNETTLAATYVPLATLEALTSSYVVDKSSTVFVDSYPRAGGETDDTPRFGRALAAAVSLGAKNLQFSDGVYDFATTTTVSVSNLTVRGAGKKATTVRTANDVRVFDVTGHYVVIEDMTIDVTNVTRSVMPIRFSNVNHGAVRRCYLQGSDGSRRAGVHFAGGSMGAVEDCTFNHACILNETWDVKISRCYIWAMSCDYGIGIYSGAGNTTITDVDIVPPLTSNANGLSGIHIDGTSGAAFNTKIIGVCLDGNPGLSVRRGIFVGNGAAATLIANVNANKMDSDVIVIDSAYNVIVSGYTGHGNNQRGNGAREIVIKQSGAQAVENIDITNAQFLQTTSVGGGGAAGPAIEIEPSVTSPGQVTIHDFSVKQPSGGGGYSLPEIKTPSIATSIDGRGALSMYRASGSLSVPAGATTATINLSSGYPMAYAPSPSQLRLVATGPGHLPAYRVQMNNGGNPNQVFVEFGSALDSNITLNWRVSLRTS